MLSPVRMSKDRPDAEAPEVSSLPTETLARLDRLATASVLAAGLAHEIATPLGVLLGELDALERRLRDVRRRGGLAPGDLEGLGAELELASTSASVMTDLVHDFQLFLRPEASRATPVADVRAAVERALRIARPRLQALARVDLELGTSPPVAAPASRIVQIVLNLLLNAAEALASRARDENLVTVRVDVAAGRALIEVSDNGPGLPESVRDRIFEPGVSQRLGRASTGLGLAISRELAHRMGGEISVSSLPGAGTTFLVSLPPAT